MTTTKAKASKQATQDVVPDFVQDLLDGPLEDQTQVQSFSYEIPEAGETTARLVEYIELGLHPRKAFKGKEKEPAMKVRMTFELLSKKHHKEITVDGVTKEVAPRMSVTWDKVINEKSKFYKLLMRLRAACPDKATATHMATFLNQPIRLKVVHAESGEGADKKTYANIDFDSINPPTTMNEEGEEIALKVSPAIGPIRIFLWDKPTKETWDSLFIDGEREKKAADGTVTTVSKNFIQADIFKALNFNDSPIDRLLEGGDYPDLTTDAEDDTPPAEIDEEVEVAEEVKAPAKAAKTTKTTTTKKAAAAMADLGLID